MNRIVREHYPVSKLPEDLREGYEGQAEVRVTIEEVAGASASPALGDDKLMPQPGLFSQFKHLARARFRTMDEVNDHVRALRDEWDHRDR